MASTPRHGSTDVPGVARHLAKFARHLALLGLKAEAAVAVRLAAELAGDGCPVCHHKHALAEPCCTACGWVSVN